MQELAELTAQEASSYHEFTAQINKHFGQERKIEVIEYLWEVAYADDQLDKYEEHFVRKIAGCRGDWADPYAVQLTDMPSSATT